MTKYACYNTSPRGRARSRRYYSTARCRANRRARDIRYRYSRKPFGTFVLHALQGGQPWHE